MHEVIAFDAIILTFITELKYILIPIAYKMIFFSLRLARDYLSNAVHSLICIQHVRREDIKNIRLFKVFSVEFANVMGFNVILRQQNELFSLICKRDHYKTPPNRV